MVEYLIKELEYRLDIEDMKVINREKTDYLQSLPQFVNFHKWLKENGVRYDSIEYPVAFGKNGDLLGIAAKRYIGPEEAYLFIPNKIIINDEKILKSEIGHIILNHEDVFKEHADSEYLRLIFFITYELSKGEKSFWYPYFQIAQDSDLPCFWEKEELKDLEDELLKEEIKEYKEDYEAEYQCLYEIAKMYPELIDISQFTEANFKKAFTTTVTRCFGWSLPYTSVIPFADCANHFIIDNQYELFNKGLHEKKKLQQNDNSITITKPEETYFTPCKMRINCDKHFSEDSQQINSQQNEENKEEVPYKTKRYIKKLMMRNNCANINGQTFQEDEQYKDMNVWDLKYISTSDEEDNDSSEEEDSDDEDEEEKKNEDTKSPNASEDQEQKVENIWKKSPGKNDSIPQIAQKLRPAKKKQRMYFAYTYNNETGEKGTDPQKSLVVKKRVEARQPESLIELLVMQKQYLYEQEQKMKVLKEQDEEEWQTMTKEYNSSEDEDDEENFAWYNDEDQGTYFVLCTKYKNVYEKGQQVFHCYGRRTNRFLLLNYGFCLNNNKYNSLSFRIWVNFNWQEERRKDEERKLKEAKEGKKTEEVDSDNEQTKDNKISKVVRLKKNRLSEEIFAYLRANLLNTYKGKNLEYLLVSAPVDSEFEMLVVGCTVNLLKGLLNSRFKTPLEKDQELLKDPNLPIRKRFAILHRINAKEILNANITLCNILMRILARFGDDKDFKSRYMRIVEDFEKEDEIMANRIKLRKYLRELVVNQKRVLNAALDKDYIEQVKDYFMNRQNEEKEKLKMLDEKKKQEDEESSGEYYDEEEEKSEETREEQKTQ